MTHVRRITFTVDIIQEIPIPPKRCCQAQIELPGVFEETRKLAAIAQEIMNSKLITGLNASVHQKLELGIMQCEVSLTTIKDKTYNALLLEHINLWKRKCEHLSNLMVKDERKKKEDKALI